MTSQAFRPQGHVSQKRLDSDLLLGLLVWSDRIAPRWLPGLCGEEVVPACPGNYDADKPTQPRDLQVLRSKYRKRVLFFWDGCVHCIRLPAGGATGLPIRSPPLRSRNAFSGILTILILVGGAYSMRVPVVTVL